MATKNATPRRCMKIRYEEKHQGPVMDLTTFALSNPPKDIDSPLIFDANALRRKLSWSKYASTMKRIAVALRGIGIANQDCVGLLSTNDLYYYVVAHGAIAAGAAFAGVPTFVKKAELATAIGVADIGVLFVSAEFLDMALCAAQAVTTPPRIIVFDPPGTEQGSYSGPRDSLSKMLISADESLFVNANEGTDPTVQTAYRLFTSGTTGSVKAVEVSHATHIKRIMSTLRKVPPVPPGSESEEQRLSLQIIGMYHVSGLVASERAFLGQWVLHVSSESDGARVLDMVHSLGITDMRLSSGIMNDLVKLVRDGNSSRDSLKSLQRAVLGGSPCRKESLDEFAQILPEKASIVMGYGSTESWAISFALYDKNWVAGCCGRSPPTIEVQIVNPDTGEAVAHGTAGEVCVRSEKVITKYYNNPVATESIFLAPPSDAGWLRTGDKGFINQATRQIFLVGRYKEIFKVRYEEVSPSEVESQLCRHPSVSDCYVTSQPARWDETDNECVAYVVRRKGTELSAQEVVDYVASALSPHKAPTGAVVFCEAIPRIHLDKVVKSQVEAVGWLEGSAKLLQVLTHEEKNESRAST